MNKDIVEWLKGYASATGAVGMADEADRLIEAAEDLIGVIKVLEYIVKRIPQ